MIQYTHKRSNLGGSTPLSEVPAGTAVFTNNSSTVPYIVLHTTDPRWCKDHVPVTRVGTWSVYYWTMETRVIIATDAQLVVTL